MRSARPLTRGLLFFFSAVLCLISPGSLRPDAAGAPADLAALARALTDGEAQAAAKLEIFAERHGASALGARAALLLGRHHLEAKRYTEARRWLGRAEADALLREYAFYWDARALRELGNEVAALERLTALRRDFPESVLSESAVEELAAAALAVNRPARALEELEAYGKVESEPALLLLRAQALEQAGRPEAAARHYVRLYYEFPRASQAREAATRVAVLRGVLGQRFPEPTLAQRLGRAEELFDGRRWRDARAEFTRLAPRLTGAERERARLRIAQCGERLGAGPGVLVVTNLKLETPELDAERLYWLAQAYRRRRQQQAMLGAVEKLATQYPVSRWTAEALYSAGNYFWLELDRTRAAGYYARVAEQFPQHPLAETAHWRVAWTAYLERRPEAAALLGRHLERFRGSRYTENALYWLGRTAERSGDAELARSFYLKLAERFPHGYFARQGGERMRALGVGRSKPTPLLALVPPAGEAPVLEEPIPEETCGHWERAEALRGLALDREAERELRAGHALTGSSRFLLEAAQAALGAGRYWEGISAARRAWPELEARPWEEAPEDVWRTVYPVAYEDHVERHADGRDLDAMLLLGMIRQESLFQHDAVSRAGAVGLMQIIPRTGRQLARRERVPYSRARLFQPDYNLRLGTAYFAGLVRAFDTLEQALAAYNAGPHRVRAWQAEREFAEPAEFVESIPFSETREYVQVVMRNAEVYRRLYGGTTASGEGQ